MTSSSYGTIPLATNSSTTATSTSTKSSPPIIVDAKTAYKLNDPAASRLFHENKIMFPNSQQRAVERHSVYSGETLKSVVYGALDGVLTAFAVVTACIGGAFPAQVVVVLGLSSLVANALSMGMGDVISTLSYREHVAQERKREQWEFELYPEGEIEEMVDLYESRGLPRDKAEHAVALMAKYKNFFIDIMVREELGLQIPSPNHNPWRMGMATSISFFVFGSIPLAGYLLVLSSSSSTPTPGEESTPSRDQTLLTASTFVTLATLFGLGALKSRFTAKVWWRAGMEFVALGALVAFTAYYIGEVMGGLI